MRGEFVMSSQLAVKLVAACAFAVMSLYCLNKGRRENDVNNLITAAICGLLTAAVFML